MSFVYAFRGIAVSIVDGRNIKVHMLAAVVAVSAGFYFQLNHTEWAILILTIASVIAAELFNTAIEKVVDLISPDHQPLAGFAKDAAAGAVLVFAIASLFVAIFLFGPKIFHA